MSTLTTTELELQVSTDLSDAALQQIIDSVESDIDSYIGPVSAYTVEFDPELLVLLRFPVPAFAVVSVIEFTDSRTEPTKTTLSSDDYELSADGWDIRRLSDGTNTRATWGWHVVVVITPRADIQRRKQAAVKLSRLEIIHTGYLTERAGDWSGTVVDMGKERARILRQLNQLILV